MEVSGYHHNVGYDFLSLRPALYAAGEGEVRFRNFKYRTLPPDALMPRCWHAPAPGISRSLAPTRRLRPAAARERRLGRTRLPVERRERLVPQGEDAFVVYLVAMFSFIPTPLAALGLGIEGYRDSRDREARQGAALAAGHLLFCVGLIALAMWLADRGQPGSSGWRRWNTAIYGTWAANLSFAGSGKLTTTRLSCEHATVVDDRRRCAASILPNSM